MYIVPLTPKSQNEGVQTQKRKQKMQYRDEYSALYMQRRDLDKKIKDSYEQIRMLKMLRKQVSRQIRHHLTNTAMRSIKGYENNRADINNHHSSDRVPEET
jgi:uncharacterized coiled-coil DUF342 family protein